MGFVPGDPVRIVEGTFAGHAGRVVGREEARALWENSGGQAPPCKLTPGLVWVVLDLFGRTVPVLLEDSQLQDRRKDDPGV